MRSATQPLPPPGLADHVSEYDERRPRPPADPIGERGLPETRAELDHLVVKICRLLKRARAAGLNGNAVARALNLTGTRAVRKLVAYAQLRLGHPEIVGLPGGGYFWGPAVPAIRKRMIGHARKMGRCWFAKSAIYRRGGIAAAFVQLAFDFMTPPGDGQAGDELAAMVAAEDIAIGDVLEELIRRMRETAEGRAALAVAAERHGDVLLPASVRSEVLASIDQIRRSIVGLDRPAGGPPSRSERPDPGTEAPPPGADISRTSGGHNADMTVD